MKGDTKTLLIETSIDLMLQQGFSNTGIGQILKKADVPKGSFYHYFASKDALGAAVVETYGDDMLEHTRVFFRAAQGEPLARLRAYFADLLERFENEFGSCRCLLGRLGLELANQNEGMRTLVNRYFVSLEGIFAEILGQAQAAGQLRPGDDVAELAQTLLGSWEGALLRANVAQDIAPMRLFFNFFDGLGAGYAVSKGDGCNSGH